jgi:regulator of protease activity HflC (stomatin/prohibitin superfamily)
VSAGPRGWLRGLRARARAHLQTHFPGYVVGTLLALLLVTLFWPRIFITVHAGEMGVLYRRFFGGTVVDQTYKEGFYVIFPWDIMTVYAVRYQTTPHAMTILTSKGLKVGLRLSIRYRPETEVLGVLHQVVGPEYLKTIVIPEVEASLRTVLGQFDAEEIYAGKGGVVQQVVNESLEQVAQRFVKIDDVVVTAVDLPPRIQAAIEAKLEEQQLAEAYQFKLERERREAERKGIEAAGIKAYNAMVEASLSEKVLRWKGIEATRELAASPNAKMIVIGSGKDGLPVILDGR